MYNVLIVDDDPMVAMINEKYVTKNDRFCVCGKCRDGNSALEFLEKNNVDLVILDVFMPCLDGIEMLHKMREKNHRAAVIMVTAANDRDTLEKALALGAVDYLVKPFAFDRFQLALEKFLVQKKALENAEVLNQNRIDSIMGGNSHAKAELMPKGIQETTLNTVMDYIKTTDGRWLSGDEIAEKVGLSNVTVRRYLNYLMKIGNVSGEINYETGGRPKMIYRKR